MLPFIKRIRRSQAGCAPAVVLAPGDCEQKISVNILFIRASLETRGKFGRVNFCKDFWDC